MFAGICRREVRQPVRQFAELDLTSSVDCRSTVHRISRLELQHCGDLLSLQEVISVASPELWQ